MRFIFLLSTVIILLFSNCSQSKNERTNILRALNIEQASFEELKPDQQVEILRKKVAPFANRGFTPTRELLVEEIFPHWHEMSPSSQINNMKNTTYHITCGKISYLLRDVYSTMGWQSSTYNFGFDNTATSHEVTLVSIDTTKVLLQDAFYNFSLLSDMDFFGFLKSLKTKNFDENSFNSDSLFVDLIVEKYAQPSENISCQPAYVREIKHQLDSLDIYSFNVDLMMNMYDSCYGFLHRLEQKSDSTIRFEELFLHQLSTIENQPDWQEKVDQILSP